MFNKYIDKDEWDVALVDIQNALNVLKDQTYTIKGNMDNFKRTQESAVDEMVNESIDAKMKDYSRVMHAFKKFFNQDELEKILDTKVDQTKMLKVVQTKASKTELDLTIDLMKQLFDRMRTMSIMQVELSRTLLP